MAGYFDQLGDVVPQETIDAMHAACADATHHGGGRGGEPVVLAGIRALLKRAVLREQHDEEITRLVRIQRADFEIAQEQLRARADAIRDQCRDDSRRLEHVRQLVDQRRKTLPMERLMEVLDTPIE